MPYGFREKSAKKTGRCPAIGWVHGVRGLKNPEIDFCNSHSSVDWSDNTTFLPLATPDCCLTNWQTILSCKLKLRKRRRRSIVSIKQARADGDHGTALMFLVVTHVGSTRSLYSFL